MISRKCLDHRETASLGKDSESLAGGGGGGGGGGAGGVGGGGGGGGVSRGGGVGGVHPPQPQPQPPLGFPPHTKCKFAGLNSTVPGRGGGGFGGGGGESVCVGECLGSRGGPSTGD